jgi:hypothetical protein
MDEAAAGRAYAAKVASGVGQADIFGHVSGGLLGRATRQAVDFSGLQAPPSCAPSRLKKGSERLTLEDDETPTVDRPEPLLLPVADRVAVATEELRHVIDRVGSMNLDPPRIGSALAHGAPYERSDVDF